MGVYLELWGELGVLWYCWVLAPPAQQGPRALHLRSLAWAALGCSLLGLGKQNSTSFPLCFACFKQPCIQTKGIKFHVIWKLKQIDFFSVREISGCFPERIKTVFQQFC